MTKHAALAWGVGMVLGGCCLNNLVLEFIVE